MIYIQIVAVLKLGQPISWASSVYYFKPGPDVRIHVLKIGFGPFECQCMRMDGLRSLTTNANAKKHDFFEQLDTPKLKTAGSYKQVMFTYFSPFCD